MRRHYDREIYFMVGEPPITGSPFSPNPPTNVVINEKRAFKFGRMFKDLKASKKPEAEQRKDIDALVKLGEAMNYQPSVNDDDKNNSDIPSGYTYLGQFLAHEIMFGTAELPTQVLDDLGVVEHDRTPTLDLDTLYGLGPQESKQYYQDDAAQLKIGPNEPIFGFPGPFLNDLPRVGEHSKREALIPDPRNDDNLAIAQMHVALIKFHNQVVEKIKVKEDKLTGHELFKKARECVIKHFQWIVLNDFLPRIIDKGRLADAVEDAPNIFNDERGVFMPVEFSGAAFRIGHSMVRNSYEWNSIHNSAARGKASIGELFRFTNFSGDMGTSLTGVKSRSLPNDWIIDWRRFFEFDGIFKFPKEKRNHTKKIDTSFNFNLQAIPGYPHKVEEKYRPITVLNLVRGYYLGLPCGQEVAERINAKKRIPEACFLSGLHADELRDGGFHKRTPLWYYILKEAELNKENDNRLGEVGSYIVAQTFVGILMNSDISILKEKDWVPDLLKKKPRHFAMVDLLELADVVDPIGKLNCLINGIEYPCLAAG